MEDPTPTGSPAVAAQLSLLDDGTSDDDVAEPAACSGVMRKRCDSMWKNWTRRHFVLKAGCLHWSAVELNAGRPTDTTKRSCADLSRTPCEVIAGTGSALSLQPVRGHKWHRGDSHSRAGTDAPITLSFDTGAEEGRMADALQEHIGFARLVRRQRVCRKKNLRLQRLGIHRAPNFEMTDDEEAATCPVCLQEMCGACSASPSADYVVVTPCGHQFHSACVHRWVLQCTSCPLCRKELGEGAIRRKPSARRRRLGD